MKDEISKYLNEEIFKYLNEVTPTNILDLISDETLANLLAGYSFALGSGITVLYPQNENDNLKIENFLREDALKDGRGKSFNKLCYCWRDLNECGKEKYCVDCDNLKAKEYFDNKLAGPTLYRCEPLGLFDMTYPLKVEGKVIGVLFGGQVIIEEVDVEWREVLKEHKEENIDWITVPKKDTHKKYIIAKINSYSYLSQKQKEKLLGILTPSDEKDKITLTIVELNKKFSEFLKFGEMTQRLLNELHGAKKKSAERKLLNIFDEKITRIEISEPDYWWKECEKILINLISFCGIKSVNVYSRERSRLFCRIPIENDININPPISVKDVISVCEIGKLSKITDRDFLKKISKHVNETNVYRADIGNGGEICSTLLILNGLIPFDKIEFITELCRVICNDINITSLIFREREVDTKFRKQVAVIGHSFRTPLQSLLFNLEDLEMAPQIKSSPELMELITSGKSRIFDAREDTFSLLSPPKKAENFNIIELLEYIIKSMVPFAQKHPCTIKKIDDWPDKIIIQGVRYDIQRAFSNLIDNAIKYSYHDNGGSYEVWISLKQEYSNVITTISNYGIGIPEDRIDAINYFGVRGEVIDKKYYRPGTGFGLPYSIRVFEEHGGWINVTSKPSKRATEEDKKNYHRFITKVEAAIPVLNRRKQNE